MVEVNLAAFSFGGFIGFKMLVLSRDVSESIRRIGNGSVIGSMCCDHDFQRRVTRERAFLA